MTKENPIEILRKEHERVLEILGKIEKGLEKRDLKTIKENIKVLEKEFNKHSLNKEEKVLFPEIEKFIPRDGGPTGMMLIEHKDLIESIENFNLAIEENNFEKLKRIGEHIISLLREHIDKENNILFMIADMHLNNKQKETILKKFKEIDFKK